MKSVFVRSEYNYDTDQASLESGLSCDDPSLTHQSFAEECDINTIVRRFGLTGELPTALRLPTYQDFEGVFDFQTAMHAIMQAEDAFMALPADLRARFGNDAARFVDFCSAPENADELVRLGLAEKPKGVSPVTEPPTSGVPDVGGDKPA